MPTFEIDCPRCPTELAFRASEGDELQCGECGLDLAVEDGEVVYDPEEAKIRPVTFECPVCNDGLEITVYATNGENVECPDCGLEFEIRRGRAYYDTSALQGGPIVHLPDRSGPIQTRTKAVKSQDIMDGWNELSWQAQVAALVAGAVVIGGITYAVAVGGGAVVAVGSVKVAVGAAAVSLATAASA